MTGTLRILNRLEAEGIVTRYAIGGAMAAVFYIEPLLTFDLDVFVLLPLLPEGSSALATVHSKLGSWGYSLEQNCVLIEGVPVHFLPAFDALAEEAVRDSVLLPYGEPSMARVVRPEYLIAICLHSGRGKDRERVRLLRQLARVDTAALASILGRHQLIHRWNQWTR
jgi:hypothetical protein